MPRKPIVGGNWKCNPAETAKLKELVANYDGASEVLADCDVYVCPSNLHVGMVYDKFKDGVMVAPQNCNFKVRPPRPYACELSPAAPFLARVGEVTMSGTTV